MVLTTMISVVHVLFLLFVNSMGGYTLKLKKNNNQNQYAAKFD